MGINHKLSALTAAALLAAPLAALAQPKEQYTYRCVGNDGKKYYGQTLPQQCLGRPVELINKQGLMVKRIDHEGDEKARLAKEAEAEKQRELEIAAKDAQRRHRALLATYSSEKEIEDARTRDLREHQRQVRDVEEKIDAIKKRQQQFQNELALFKGADGDGPTRLKQEIVNASIDLKAQQTLLDAKKKDAVGINARYDEDRKRYAEAIAAKSKR
ncbi:MAG TPA: hypothetical protein VNC62_19160 [Burkholderiales bacterium]|jgi:hypothetical protein|nr:hypothetical protein [Burkholderiales bacterium]